MYTLTADWPQCLCLYKQPAHSPYRVMCGCYTQTYIINNTPPRTIWSLYMSIYRHTHTLPPLSFSLSLPPSLPPPSLSLPQCNHNQPLLLGLHLDLAYQRLQVSNTQMDRQVIINLKDHYIILLLLFQVPLLTDDDDFLRIIHIRKSEWVGGWEREKKRDREREE